MKLTRTVCFNNNKRLQIKPGVYTFFGSGMVEDKD